MDWLIEFPELGRGDLRDLRKGIDEDSKVLREPMARVLKTFLILCFTS